MWKDEELSHKLVMITDLHYSIAPGASTQLLMNTEYTVHLESIQTPSLFPHFVILQPYSKMDCTKNI